MTRWTSQALGLALVAALSVLPLNARAQSGAGRLMVTVTDSTKAVLPGAEVRLVGLDETTTGSSVAAATTVDSGVATFNGLVPGRYTVTVDFPGFERGVVKELLVRPGDNRQTMALRVRGVTDAVTVGETAPTVASDRSAAFGTAFTREEIESLSDDPAELQRQLLELAGPDAIIRVDSFEGSQLPPKAQIKSIHVTRDQFAAEAAQPGSTFVDIITQPGVGPISGGMNMSSRPNGLAGRSPFVSTRPPESSRSFGGFVGGTFIKEKADFSLSVNGQSQYVTPILNQAGSVAQLLQLRQSMDFVSTNALVNYALTRDQTLRLGVSAYRQRAGNQGVGQYDSPERAFASEYGGFQLRVQEAGPVGRRIFQNTRLSVASIEQRQRSSVEQPTIVIQDVRTTGGAQVGGRTLSRSFVFASDVDYIRGISSWRVGVQIDGGWYDSDMTSEYLGTYTFASQADFDAGRPLLYTQTIGDPRVKYLNVHSAVYLQNDLRINRSLTLSPGVRYSVQTHVKDKTGVAPRFGLTWLPRSDNRTAVRFSAGIFYWPMEMSRVYEQTLRFDGNHQQQVIVVNPSYPDPGPVQGQPPNKYLLGDYDLQRNLRYSAGVDHTFSPRLRVNVLYARVHQFALWRGRNLNAPVDGVRPDPAFANVIETLTDGRTLRHDITATLTMNLATAGPPSQAVFDWRRLTLSASSGRTHGRNNSEAPFSPPPSGSLDAEWGPMPIDIPYRVTASLTSSQLRNLNVNLSWNASAGSTYTMTTGVDDNGDGILNDRPGGVGRRSLRMPDQSTLNLRATYTITRASSAVPGAPPRRYRVGLTFSVSNLTNRRNYGGFSGNMQSPNFMTPTLVTNPRRADVGINVGF